VGIDGKIAVGSGDEISLSRYAPNLLRKPLLPVSPTYVFDNRIGEYPIEGTIWKRQGATVGYFALHVLQPHLFNHLRIQIDYLNHSKIPVYAAEFSKDSSSSTHIEERISMARPESVKKKVALL